MLWKRILSRVAIGLGTLFLVLLAFLIAFNNGLVLVLSSDLDTRFLAGYRPHAEPLTKLLWISYGFNGNGALIGHCPDGRDIELYYLPSLPVYPVGKIC